VDKIPSGDRKLLFLLYALQQQSGRLVARLQFLLCIGNRISQFVIKPMAS